MRALGAQPATTLLHLIFFSRPLHIRDRRYRRAPRCKSAPASSASHLANPRQPAALPSCIFVTLFHNRAISPHAQPRRKHTCALPGQTAAREGKGEWALPASRQTKDDEHGQPDQRGKTLQTRRNQAMTGFLYTKPPPELKFYPCGGNVFNARGAVIVLQKEERELPDLEFYRFDFYLKYQGEVVEEAQFIIEQLINLHADLRGSEPSWREQGEVAMELAEDDRGGEGRLQLSDYLAALNYWAPCVDPTLRSLKTEEELKGKFSMTMDGIGVVRHYFETDWVVLREHSPVRMDFKHVYKKF